MDRKVATADWKIADLAERQYGVLSAGQLRQLGVGEGAIRWRVREGRLHRIHRGVYAVAHAALAPESRFFAAVLAAGGGPCERRSVLGRWRAALSHRSAASHWGLLRLVGGPIEVLVPGLSGRSKRPGIRLHQSRSLAQTDVTLHGGIPVTTPARTISDLREAAAARRPGALSERDLRHAIRQANVLGLPIGGEDADRTRSDLETDFLALCDRHGVPPPEVNVRIGPHLVDFLWRDRRLIVETDSYIYHRGKVAFQDDRARDLDLKGLGCEVVRLSEKQINEEPVLVARILAAELRDQAAPGP
jgi:Transcriptional regulator, AbiEi antitoxin/Protein of unknown function (DUF559)